MTQRSMVGAAVAVVAVVSMAGAQSPYERTTVGRVVDTRGRPIAGVTVNAAMMALGETAADGTFRLEGASDVVRFYKPGYHPATRLAETFADPVVLERATTRPRVLPACTGARADWPDIGWLRVPTPTGVTRHHVTDDDHVGSRWELGDGMLVHGAGPLWSYGFPSGARLRGLTDVQDLLVRRPMPATSDMSPDEDLVLDIRGTKPNGRRYRFVGVLMETFEYAEATPEQAAVFDRMLDSMCYVEPGPR
jgi:hypothetical protein